MRRLDERLLRSKCPVLIQNKFLSVGYPLVHANITKCTYYFGRVLFTIPHKNLTNIQNEANNVLFKI